MDENMNFTQLENEQVPLEEPTMETEQTSVDETGYTVQNPNSYYNYEQSGTVEPIPVKPKKNGLSIALIVVSSLLILTLAAAGVALWGMWSMSEETEETQNTSSQKEDGESKKEESSNEKEEQATVPSFDSQSKEDSDRLAIEDVVAKTLPQVVGVVSSSGDGLYAGESQGSGIIFTEDGYIITNAHVVEGAKNVKIVLPDDDKTTYEAQVVGSDAKTDLAVLKAKVGKDKLNAADLGRSSELRLGETVVALGNPYGLELQSSVTSGIVSALNRKLATSVGNMTLIQTDAAINPGNSGGALVNLHGQVVGICSSKIADEEAEGLGFAIPIDNALPIIEELIEKGYISGRPMIGIQGQDFSAQAAAMSGISGLPTGVLVVYIDENSSAYEAGLRPNDIITGFDGKTVSCYADLDAAKEECKAGDKVKIQFYRYTNKKTYNVDIVLSESTGQ